MRGDASGLAGLVSYFTGTGTGGRAPGRAVPAGGGEGYMAFCAIRPTSASRTVSIESQLPHLY